MRSNLIKLSSRVKIRKEYFGGILFNTNTGDVVEVDREAFKLILIIKDTGVVDAGGLLAPPLFCRDGEGIKAVLSSLTAAGIIDIMPSGVSESFARILEEKSLVKIRWPIYKHLSAPETVHWAVTFKCGQSCPDCYVERHKRLFTNELDTQDALKLVDKIADSGVFQLAIGGGEPFLRNDLEDIVRSARNRGLIVHVTTGKYELEEKRLANLAKFIKTLQIGIRMDELLYREVSTDRLRILVTRLNENGIIAGANLIMTRTSICNLDKIVEILTGIGFKRYTLLRYKPPANINRWLQEKPDKPDLDILEERLTAMQERHPDISFRIDCAFSFLERRLNPAIAITSGIRGCVAFDRIMAIAPDGSVYPCSQLVGNIFRAGNLLNEDFESIWNENQVVKKYRDFRGGKSFQNGGCGKCQARAFCGGCRVFAEDAVGSDPGCPEPLYQNEDGAGGN